MALKIALGGSVQRLRIRRHEAAFCYRRFLAGGRQIGSGGRASVFWVFDLKGGVGGSRPTCTCALRDPRRSRSVRYLPIDAFEKVRSYGGTAYDPAIFRTASMGTPATIPGTRIQCAGVAR